MNLEAAKQSVFVQTVENLPVWCGSVYPEHHTAEPCQVVVTVSAGTGEAAMVMALNRGQFIRVERVSLDLPPPPLWMWLACELEAARSADAHDGPFLRELSRCLPPEVATELFTVPAEDLEQSCFFHFRGAETYCAEGFEVVP